MLFRYEVRRWLSGVIPDVAAAVASPQLLSSNPRQAAWDFRLVEEVPACTWGRDELRTCDMWNCNSLLAWLLERSDHRVIRIRPPAHGRAPGWQAGLVLAARQQEVDGTSLGVVGPMRG